MTYRQKLAAHPGVPTATILSLCGALAGAERGGWIGALLGFLVISLGTWLPVLLTARTLPDPPDDE